MSGEDDRGQAPAKKTPLFDEADVILPRARRVKPPPGIISAGGVDMARAHASGIKLRDAAAPEPVTDQRRVVVAVETDPRKVPTHKRLLEGRDPTEDGTRSAMLPGGTLHATAPATPASGSAIARGARPNAAQAEPAVAPPAPIKEQKLPLAMRVALVTILLLVLVGVAERYREPVADGSLAAKTRAATVVNAEPPLPVQPAMPSPFVEAPRVAVLPVSSSPASSAASSAPPASNGEALRRPAKTPPPRATFTPPFQLPGEKN
jgi:hypothetical protein